MFNEYGMYQMIKLRQEEIERNARNAWNNYQTPQEENSLKRLTNSCPSQVTATKCQCV
jgi:hypothetical protein